MHLTSLEEKKQLHIDATSIALKINSCIQNYDDMTSLLIHSN